MKYPILRDRDISHLPRRDEGCLACGHQLDRGTVYLSAGAVAEDVDHSRLMAFFQIGYHSKTADVSGSGNVDVIDELVGGQFDLYFCSTTCLKRFFADLVAELESRLGF